MLARRRVDVGGAKAVNVGIQLYGSHAVADAGVFAKFVPPSPTRRTPTPESERHSQTGTHDADEDDDVEAEELYRSQHYSSPDRLRGGPGSSARHPLPLPQPPVASPRRMIILPRPMLKDMSPEIAFKPTKAFLSRASQIRKVGMHMQPVAGPHATVTEDMPASTLTHNEAKTGGSTQNSPQGSARRSHSHRSRAGAASLEEWAAEHRRVFRDSYLATMARFRGNGQDAHWDQPGRYHFLPSIGLQDRKTPFVSRADLHAAVCERLNEKIKTRRESARLPSAGSHAHAAAERGANANSPKHDAASSASASHPPGSHDAPHAEEKTVGVQGHSNEQAQQHAPLAHGRGELGSGLLQLDREQVMKDNRVLRSQHRLWEKRSQRMLVSLRKTHAHSLGERKKGEGSTDSSGMSASNASNVS